MRAQNRAWHQRNRERCRDRHRAWIAQNRERVKAKNLAWHLRAKYGLSVEQYRALGWTCFVCGAIAGRGKRRLHIDHDHNTGDVRGLLCSPCNTAIGSLKEDPDLLRKAASYLEQFTGDAEKAAS